MSGMLKIFFALTLSCLLVSVLAGITRDQIIQLAQGYRNTCIRKLGYNDTVKIDGVRHGQFPEGSHELKCYTKCVMMTLLRTNLMNGESDLERYQKFVATLFDEDVAKKMIDTSKQCYAESNLQTDDLCQYMWDFTKCAYTKAPEVFFFP